MRKHVLNSHCERALPTANGIGRLLIRTVPPSLLPFPGNKFVHSLRGLSCPRKPIENEVPRIQASSSRRESRYSNSRQGLPEVPRICPPPLIFRRGLRSHYSLRPEALDNRAEVHNTSVVAVVPDTAVEGRSPGCMEPVARTAAACTVVDPVASSSRQTGSGPVTDGKGRHRHVRAEGNSEHSREVARSPAACQKAGKVSRGLKDADILIGHA